MRKQEKILPNSKPCRVCVLYLLVYRHLGAKAPHWLLIIFRSRTIWESGLDEQGLQRKAGSCTQNLANNFTDFKDSRGDFLQTAQVSTDPWLNSQDSTESLMRTSDRQHEKGWRQRDQEVENQRRRKITQRQTLKDVETWFTQGRRKKYGSICSHCPQPKLYTN